MNLNQQVLNMNSLSSKQLKQQYKECFNEECPRFFNDQYIMYKLSYFLQSQRFGGLPEQFIKILALYNSYNRADSLIPGNQLVKIYKNKKFEVKILEDGFLYAGITYKTLTGAARAICGKNISGNKFFKIKEK